MLSSNITYIQGKLLCLKCVENNYSDILHKIPVELRVILLCLVILVSLFIIFVIVVEYYLPAMETFTFRFELTNYAAGRIVMSLISTLPFIMDSMHNLVMKQQIVSFEYMIGVPSLKILLGLGIGGLVAKEKLHIDWWPMTSEYMWFQVALISLPVLFFEYETYWYNSGMLLLLFLGRMIFVIMDRQVMKYFKTPDSRCVNCVMVKGEKEQPLTDPTENEVQVLKFPKCGLKNIPAILYAVLTFPTRLLLFYIVPHPYSKKFASLFWVTILICIGFFIVLSYFLTWALVELFYTWNLPDILIYSYIIPFGLSFVSCISTIMAFNKGHGEMGVSNAYGSSTCDILFGFGLLSFVQALSLDTNVMEHTNGFLHIAFTMILLSVLPMMLCWILSFGIRRLFGLLTLLALIVHSIGNTIYDMCFLKIETC